MHRMRFWFGVSAGFAAVLLAPSSAMAQKLSADIITCFRSEDLGKHAKGRKTFVFSANDCRGRQVDDKYQGFATQILVCGGMDNFQIISSPPAITLFGLRMPCGAHESSVRVTYIKVTN